MSTATVFPEARPAARRVTATSRAARPAPSEDRGRRPALRLVETGAIRRTRRVRVGLWLGVFVVTASLVAVVAFRVVVAQGQLAIDRIEGAALVEQQRYQELRLKMAGLSSPETIIGRAKARGMVEAVAPTFVPVPTDPATRSSSDATSPTAGWEFVKPHLER